MPDVIGYVRNGLLEPLIEALERNPEVSNQQDSKGLTVLHWAANHRFYEAVMVILKNGKADLTLKDCRGRTALDHAISGGHRRIIEGITQAS